MESIVTTVELGLFPFQEENNLYKVGQRSQGVHKLRGVFKPTVYGFG